MDYIYLDNAATTPILPEVADIMDDVNRTIFGNPSSIHRFGNIARDKIEESRLSISKALKVKPSELFFTSGATESITTILYGAIRGLGVQRIVTSRLEHPATLQTIEKIGRLGLAEVVYLEFDKQGHINLQHLSGTLSNGTKTLVCLMHANNELGNLLPMKKVSEICSEHGALFLSDTVQSIGKFDNDFSEYPDFAIGSAHKFHGPKGVGFMVVKSQYKIDALMVGGAQERNMRAGTENLASIVGMAKALDFALKNVEDSMGYISELKNLTIERVKNLIPDAVFNGDACGIATILNIGLPKATHNKMVVFNLDSKGFAVSGGSACSSGVLNISHVIKALGLAETIIPIRVSFSRFNNAEEVELFVNMLKNY